MSRRDSLAFRQARTLVTKLHFDNMRPPIKDGEYTYRNHRYPPVVRRRKYPESWSLPSDRRLRPRNTGYEEAGRAYAHWSHKGERLKYVHDTYIKHPEAVAERQPTSESRVLAYLHDCVENRISKEVLGKFDPAKMTYEKYVECEEIIVWQTLYEIARYFHDCGFGTTESRAVLRLPLNENAALPLSEFADYFKNRGYVKEDNDLILTLIRDLNVLTKRVTDTDYRAYIKRIIDFAAPNPVMVKYADNDDNELPERNPAERRQKQKDRDRLARYRESKHDLKTARPDLIARLRPARADRPNIRQQSGRPKHSHQQQRAGWRRDV